MHVRIGATVTVSPRCDEDPFLAFSVSFRDNSERLSVYSRCALDTAPETLDFVVCNVKTDTLFNLSLLFTSTHPWTLPGHRGAAKAPPPRTRSHPVVLHCQASLLLPRQLLETMPPTLPAPVQAQGPVPRLLPGTGQGGGPVSVAWRHTIS